MIARLVRPALLVAATAALGACTAYDPYGYSGVSVGYSTGGYSPYGSHYSRYPYYGWYDDFYYPGVGYYVYDRYGSRHRWNDGHRRYWEGRRGDRRDRRENWSGYQPSPDGIYGWRTQPAQQGNRAGVARPQGQPGVERQRQGAGQQQRGSWGGRSEGAQPAPRAQAPRSESRPAARPQSSRPSEATPSRGGWRTTPRSED